MKLKSFLMNNATKLALIVALGAFALFVPASLTASAPLRVFLIVLIVSFLCCGVWLLVYGNKATAAQLHFFLYDRRRDKILHKDELTPEGVQDAIAYYLHPYTEDVNALWEGLPKPLRLQLEGEPHFRPLVVYHLLYALSQKEAETIFALFSEASESLITHLCHTIAKCGDQQMADYIYHLKRNTVTDPERVVLFFSKNMRCFATRALRYVEQNFDMFYVPKSRLSK